MPRSDSIGRRALLLADDSDEMRSRRSPKCFDFCWRAKCSTAESVLWCAGSSEVCQLLLNPHLYEHENFMWAHFESIFEGGDKSRATPLCLPKPHNKQLNCTQNCHHQPRLSFPFNFSRISWFDFRFCLNTKFFFVWILHELIRARAAIFFQHSSIF